MEGFKTVEAQQFFAKNMYLDFMTLRFGITPCCYKDPEGSMIKKYLCDWQSKKKDIPLITDVTTEIFKPSNPQVPCLDVNAPDWCEDCSNEPENAEELEGDIILLQADLAILETDLANKQAQVDAKQTDVINKQSQIDTTQISLYNSQIAYNINCTGLNPIQPYCTNLSNTIATLTSDLATYQADLAVLLADLAILEADRDLLQAQVDAKKEEILALQIQFCVDDAECMTIYVVDTNGQPVENFEIYIDGGNAGFTNYKGEYKFTIYNASVDTDHTLQICYCFSTEGACRQQKITVTVEADECAEECKQLVACDQIEVTQIIEGLK